MIPDIHRHRETLARKCGYDMKKLMDHYRQAEAARKTKAHQLVSFVEAAGTMETSLALHDKPSRKKK